MNKQIMAIISITFSLLCVTESVFSQPTYYYISFFVNEYDSVFGASIIESGGELTTIPDGYSRTTKEAIHNFGYLTPSELRLEVFDEPFGSYIIPGYGSPPAEPKDQPVRAPEFKYVICGSFTAERGQGEHTLYVSVTTECNGQVVFQGEASAPVIAYRVDVARTFYYLPHRIFEWRQYGYHEWIPTGLHTVSWARRGW